MERGLILLCDHASNQLPKKYGTLGLTADQFERHIAYDIGAKGLTLGLASVLKVPAVLTRFSRMLIDPNRGDDDPTQIMKLSDGAVITGNHPISEQEIKYRRENFHVPYHKAIVTLIEQFLAKGIVPAIFAIHSFTDNWKGVSRPWHAGILWDQDDRLPKELFAELAKQTDILVGDNEPYDGAMGGDTMYTHCIRRGLAHALLEVRQDLISNQQGIDEWVGRMAKVLEPAVDHASLHQIEYFGSRTGPVDIV